MRWRSWLVAVAALAALPSVARADDEIIDLVIWGIQIGPMDKGLDDVVRRFEEDNPNIRVHMLGMGSGRMNPQKLMTAIVGEVPPDIVRQDRFAVPDWAYLGAFEPLDDLIARDRDSDPRTPTPEKYYAAPWAEGMWGGKVYGIPEMADTRVLYWNKSVFREMADELRAAGLDPTRPPQTWSETLAYSRVLTEINDDGTLKRAGFIPNFGNSWLYLYGFQNEASFISPDGRECTLNTPEAREALQFMKDGYEILGGIGQTDKFTSTLRGEASDPFFMGQIAMKIDGDWTISGIARYAPRLDFGVAPPPIPDDRFHRRGRFTNVKDRFISWTGGFCFVIPKGAKNIEAAWKFIKHITSPEMRLLEMESFAALERERGRLYVPRPTANIEANELARARLMPDSGPLHDAGVLHAELLAVSKVRPSTPAGQRLWDEHVRSMHLALRQPMTIGEALQSGEDRVQKHLDQIYSRHTLPLANLTVPIATGVIGFFAGVALLIGWYKRQNLGKLASHEARWGMLLVSPWVAGFLIFTLGPMIASLYLSFTNYNIFESPRWVGWQNYNELFGVDAEILTKSLWNVLYLGGVGIPLGLMTGLATAMLLNVGVRGINYYRTVFYLPAVVPGVASIILWMWIMNPDPNRGILNAIWVTTLTVWFGTEPPGWLGVELWAKPALITMGMWGAAGGMLLWLAGLKGIPQQLYEAASIDGATNYQQFWNITIPQLSPLLFFNVIMGGIAVLQTFDVVYVVTGGEGAGPNDTLLVPVYYLFQQAFYYFKLGYASAIAWILFVLVLLITAVQFLLARKWVFYEVDK